MMTSVNDVFTVFLVLVGTGGASTGVLYWLLNQPVFEDLTHFTQKSVIKKPKQRSTTVTIKEKLLKLSANEKASFLLVFSELKHAYYCQLQFQSLNGFQFPLAHKEWLLILKNPKSYMAKANPLQQQFVEQLKQSLREDLVLHQRLAKQILSVSRHSSGTLEDSYLQTLILRRTLYWQIALELCIATLDMPVKANPQWQSVTKKIQVSSHKQATALKIKTTPVAVVEPCAVVEDYWQLLEVGKARLNKMVPQHLEETAFAKRHHYQIFTPVQPADGDTLVRLALNTPLLTTA